MRIVSMEVASSDGLAPKLIVKYEETLTFRADSSKSLAEEEILEFKGEVSIPSAFKGSRDFVGKNPIEILKANFVRVVQEDLDRYCFMHRDCGLYDGKRPKTGLARELFGCEDYELEKLIEDRLFMFAGDESFLVFCKTLQSRLEESLRAQNKRRELLFKAAGVDV